MLVVFKYIVRPLQLPPVEFESVVIDYVGYANRELFLEDAYCQEKRKDLSGK